MGSGTLLAARSGECADCHAEDTARWLANKCLLCVTGIMRPTSSEHAIAQHSHTAGENVPLPFFRPLATPSEVLP